jgi:hypothetical protein
MERERDNIRFALKNILTVAARRKNDALTEAAKELFAAMDRMPPSVVHAAGEKGMQTLEEIRSKTLILADELKMLTNFEIREVLFPLPEIKRSTREFGTWWSSNYFEWLMGDEHYSPERLMGILEDDLHKLEVAKAHLQKRFRPEEMGLQKRR